MAWTSLILNFLARIAWPLAAITIIIVFRSKIRDMIEQATEISLPGGITVKRRVRQRIDSATITLASSPPPASPTRRTDMQHVLAAFEQSAEHINLSEGYAVVNVSDCTNAAIQHIYGEGSHEMPPPWSVERGADDQLAAIGASQALRDAYQQLWQSRLDVVVFKVSMNQQDVVEYLEASRELIRKLVRPQADYAAATPPSPGA